MGIVLDQFEAIPKDTLPHEWARACLPHLRRALALARDEEAMRRLAEVALSRLAPLATDAGEYVRKMDWNNRHEPKHLWEQVSWVRAVALFLGGGPGRAQGGHL